MQNKVLIGKFAHNLKLIRPVLVEKMGQENAVDFSVKCLARYREQILPGAPYIGGNANSFTENLVQTSTALAIYHELQDRGCALDEAGEIIYRGMMRVAGSLPRPAMRLYGLWLYSRTRYPRWRREAQQSMLRRYAEDWVFTFVEGDGEPFDFGLDMYECGIVKYLHREGAAELTPYLCAVDYITHAAMGIELRRKQTLAYGCEKCDFRFRVHGQPADPTWPPAFPEKDCGCVAQPGSVFSVGAPGLRISMQ